MSGVALKSDQLKSWTGLYFTLRPRFSVLADFVCVLPLSFQFPGALYYDEHIKES